MVISNVVAAFTAGLFQQNEGTECHAAIERFAHVVDRQGRHRNGRQGLHLDPRPRLDSNARLNAEGALVNLTKVDLHAVEPERVTERMSSDVFFAAIIPASRATSSTSPLLTLRSMMVRSVPASIVTDPPARAIRLLSGLQPTSTMRLAPDSSKWVRRLMVNS